MSYQSRRSVLSLYRRLLRLHDNLPQDMRKVGTLFVREEFKKHKGTSADHAQSFFKEWKVRLFVFFLLLSFPRCMLVLLDVCG